MRKVLSFSAFLMIGLLVSQILPGAVGEGDRKSTRLNSSHNNQSRMPSSA